MDYSRDLSADLSLFMLFVLLMIFAILWQKKGERSYKEKLFMGICSSTMLMIDGGGSRIVIYVVARISESLDAGNREGSFPYRLELSCGYKIVDYRETKSSAGRATFFSHEKSLSRT